MARNFAARHTTGDPDWYTPRDYVAAAHRVMGRIDCDPASDAAANAVIGATRYETLETNGLRPDCAWRGRVFLNPPGTQTAAFWTKLIQQYTAGITTQAIWIGYSLEQLQTLQQIPGVSTHPLDFPLCIPKRRIAFVENAARRDRRYAAWVADPDPDKAPFKEKSSPSHANYIVYLEPRLSAVASSRAIACFEQVFGAFGIVVG